MSSLVFLSLFLSLCAQRFWVIQVPSIHIRQHGCKFFGTKNVQKFHEESTMPVKPQKGVSFHFPTYTGQNFWGSITKIPYTPVNHIHRTLVFNRRWLQSCMNSLFLLTLLLSVYAPAQDNWIADKTQVMTASQHTFITSKYPAITTAQYANRKTQ